MKLRRLLSLAGFLAALLVGTGGRLQAADVISVGNAAAFPGGSDTVEVYVTTDQDYQSVQVTLSFAKTLLSYRSGSVVPNQSAWDPAWGAPQVAIDTAGGTVTVGFVSLTNINAKVPESSSALKLFSMVFDVDSAASTGSSAITPSGIFVSIDENYNPEETEVTSLVPGTFLIQSNFSIMADSVSGGIGVTVPVTIYLTNGVTATGVEFTIKYDSSQVKYAGEVEINSDAWSGGSPQPAEVTDYGDSVKVGIYTLSLANLPVSNDARWIAKVSLMVAAGAVETAANPLTLSQGIVVTVDENYNPVENDADLISGNFEIVGKFGLRVGSDAAAPIGGSDTVKVYLRNSETIVGVEAELAFDQDNFTVSESDVTFSSSLFAGGTQQVEVSVTDSTLKVVGYTLSPTDSVAPSSTERLLFWAIFNVNEDATAGYDSIAVSGLVTSRDENYETQEATVTGLTKGAFRIRAPYEVQVQSRNSGPAANGVEVSVLLTNQEAVVSSEILLKFDTDDLTYVSGSVMANGAIWTSGSAPTPDVIAGGDSVKVGFIDLTGSNKIAAGGSGAVLFTLQFDLDASLTIGSSTTITPSGVVAIVDENFNVTEPTTAFIAGTITVTLDVLPPGSVENAMATAGTSSIMLGWTNPSDTDLDYVKIVRRTASDTVVVLLDNDPVLGDEVSLEDVDVTSGVDYYYDFSAADLNGNMATTVTVGPVSIGPPPVVITNAITVKSSKALSGGTAITRVYLTNTEPVAGISFKFTFDEAVLQITDIQPGRYSAGLSQVSEIDV